VPVGPESWTDIQAGAGVSTFGGAVGFECATAASPNKWASLIRTIFVFDTSALVGLTILSATIDITLGDWQDPLVDTPGYNIYGATPADPESVLVSDYGNCGSVAFSSALTAYSATHSFQLNALGIANINRDGFSSFSCRESKYDVGSDTPAWQADAWTYIEFGAPAVVLTVIASLRPLDPTIAKTKPSLELIRNLEMQCDGLSYVTKAGLFKYESRYARHG
jgi:hypothetical protein